MNNKVPLPLVFVVGFLSGQLFDMILLLVYVVTR